MTTLILIVVKNKYKVYSHTAYPNGWSRRLVRVFNTSRGAERFMSTHP